MANDSDTRETDRAPERDRDAPASTRPRGGAPEENQNAATPGDGTEQDAQWATQDEYERRTAQTTDVVVPRGGMKFRVAQESPMKFASLVEKHGLNDLRAQMDVPGGRDVPDVSMDDDDLSEVTKTIAAFREMVVPNVVRPKKAYWDEPPADVDPSDPEAFDLSRLHEEDLVTLVAAVTGQDADEMIDNAQEAADGETATDGGTVVEDGTEDEYAGRFRR